jgi:cell division protein FtsB
LRIKPVIVGLSLGLALWVTLGTVVSSNSARQIDELRADIQKKESENERLAREIDDLKQRLKDLSARPDVKEKLIREETGFVRPDELVFQFGPARSPRGQGRP